MSSQLKQAVALTYSLSRKPYLNHRNVTAQLDLKPVNSKISSFMRNGHVEDAQQLFDQLPHRNTVTYNAMIRGYFQNGFPEKAASLYNQMVVRDLFSYNTMIFGLMKCGHVKEAEGVFESMKNRDIVTWNSMILGYVDNNLMSEAMTVFNAMPLKDVVSWNLVLGGLVKVQEFEEAEELFRGMVVRDVASWTIIVKAFVGTGKIVEARKTFDDMPMKDIGAWNTMIGGYVQQNFVEIAEGLFHKMPGKDRNSWSIMIDGFLSIGRTRDALRLFHETPQKHEKSWNSIMLSFVKKSLVREAHAILEKVPFSGIVSWTNIMIGYFNMGEVENANKVFQLMPCLDTAVWNAAIFGFGENDQFENGIRLFIRMKEDGVSMDEATFTSFLIICSNMPSINLGQQIHAESIKLGIDCFTAAANAFITMYFRCGNMDSALLVFNSMTCHDTISWNSVICGLAQHGLAEKATEVFEKMRSSRAEPNQITFVGRFGLIDEAMDVLNEMTIYGLEVGASVWGALLGACRLHKNMSLAEIAGERILDIEPSNSGVYLILAEMYLANGMREKAYNMWVRMKDSGVKKQPGCSWIELSIGGNVFLAEDRAHPEFESISCALNLIYQEMGFRNVYLIVASDDIRGTYFQC
ncbi:pentatricopeptide repeat-containing protein At4g02750-like [Salvia hispanica]|uniref:pentatricopeptide repeat-containing protein At4g02750-like n=1 Tax=Salvia hispanica TaxID=49212 RepID=UPI0020093229|nr:pentatricopeptide repeat-containing protein At4g02750-like [Salvia hispanica]